MPGTLLYVSHPHLHGGGTGAHRTARFARYLSEAGWNVVVLCGPAPAAGPAVVHESFPFTVVPVAGFLDRRLPESRAGAAADAAPSGRTGAQTTPSRVRRLLREALFVPDPQVFWIPSALREAHRVLHRRVPEIVLCSAPPFSSFIAGVLLRGFRRTPLVLDYRDVWLGHPWWPVPSWRRGFEAWLERRLLASASLVIANHEPMRRQLVASQPRVASRCVVIPNGFDPGELGPPVRPRWQPGTTFEIVYSGTLYDPPPGQGDGAPSVQRPAGLFRALRGLRHRGTFGAGGFRMTFVGARRDTPEAANIVRCAGEFGLAEQVQVLTRMEKPDAVALMRRAHILLNFLCHTEAQVAQKAYDYMHLEIPILSLFRGTEINATIARTARAGPILDPEDSTGIAASITDIVAAYAGGRAPIDIDRDFVNQFDIRAQGARLDTELRRIMATRSGRDGGFRAH